MLLGHPTKKRPDEAYREHAQGQRERSAAPSDLLGFTRNGNEGFPPWRDEPPRLGLRQLLL